MQNQLSDKSVDNTQQATHTLQTYNFPGLKNGLSKFCDFP